MRENGCAIEGIAAATENVDAAPSASDALRATGVRVAADPARRIAQLERALADKEDLLARERAARRRIERESVLRGHVLDLLSSELRGPIHAILSWSQLLQREVLASHARDRALAAIERSSRRQLTVLEELVGLSGTGVGPCLDVVDVDLAQLLRAAVDAVAPAAAHAGIALDASGAGDERVAVFGDRKKLAQVVDAVLDVLIAEAHSGDRVAVGAAIEGGHGVLRFASSAARSADLGVLAHDRPAAVPDPDFDARAFRLYLAKRVIELHGGTTDVAAGSDGGGVTLALTLPARSAVALREGAPHPARLDDVRVLVAVDDDDLRELLATVLATRGARVALARGVDDATDPFPSRGADVVVTDLENALVERVRRLHRGAPVLAVARSVSVAETTRPGSAELDAELRQPVDPELFVATVLDLAARAAASRR